MNFKKVLISLLFILVFTITNFTQTRLSKEETKENKIRKTTRKKAEYIKNHPDLILTFKKTHVLIKNIGMQKAKNFTVDFVLSTDQKISVKNTDYSPEFKEDGLLFNGRKLIKELKPGATIEIQIPLTFETPNNSPAGKQFIGIIVDSQDSVKEVNEKNNTLFYTINLKGSTVIKKVTEVGVWNSESGNVEFVITGSGFGPLQKDKDIQLGSHTLDIENWSGNQVIAFLSQDLNISFGEKYDLYFTSNNMTISNKYSVLLKIDLEGCFYQTPDSNEYEMEAKSGSLLELQGGGFGDKQGDITIRFGNLIVPAISWSDEQIQFKCPKLPPGEYPVFLEKNEINITIKKTTFQILP